MMTTTIMRSSDVAFGNILKREEQQKFSTVTS